MKKQLLLLAVALFATATAVRAQAPQINSTNFPDENFRAIVAGTAIDKNSDGYLSTEEIAAVTELDVGEKNIASLKGIEFFTALKRLWCYSNQMTSLDVSKNKALILLSCFNNQIKEDQMQTLVNSLPTVTGGKFWVIDTKNSNEQNVCTEPQVKIATDKGWKVNDFNGGISQEYTGSEDTAIRSIEVSPETKSHWYTLDGKRLSGKPTQKGICVYNGRKVVVK